MTCSATPGPSTRRTCTSRPAPFRRSVCTAAWVRCPCRGDLGAGQRLARPAPDRRAQGAAGGTPPARLLPQGRGAGPLPHQPLLPAQGPGRGLPAGPLRDPEPDRHPPAREPLGHHDLLPGPDPGHRAGGLRQDDHARGSGRPHQRDPARPHPDGRGPHRVRPHQQGIAGQPARGSGALALVRQGAAPIAARGPRRHPGRRDARPRDHLARDHRLGDRPPGARDPAHDDGLLDGGSHHQRVSAGPAGPDPHDGLGLAEGRDLAGACCPAATARAASPPTRSSATRPTSAG